MSGASKQDMLVFATLQYMNDLTSRILNCVFLCNNMILVVIFRYFSVNLNIEQLSLAEFSGE